MNPNQNQLQIDLVKEYYGKVLSSKQDLKTTACCVPQTPSLKIQNLLSKIHPEVTSKFYGCGLPIPEALEGKTILDLGCGTGRDCFILAALAGPSGKVVGVDMTQEQLEVARKHISYHKDRFAMAALEFKLGFIEDLRSLDLADNSVDVVISNCVINLSPDKGRVFSEIFRVLKPGGELHFSDVYADRRLPKEFADDPILLGECLGGALYTEDLRRILYSVGCKDSRTLAKGEIFITQPEIKSKTGMARFFSITTSAFKLDLEDRCEDYGQVATYLGTLGPLNFELDDHHNFTKGKPMLVCSNTAKMLGKTRFAEHFRIEGNLSTHFGLFDCGPVAAANSSGSPGPAACC